MGFTRRLFVRWTAVTSAALGAVRGRLFALDERTEAAPAQGGLTRAGVLPLAQAVLPAELGAAGIERVTNDFVAWIGGYRENEETLHPYGSERLGSTGPSPVAAWTRQLADLDAEARAAHGTAFPATTPAQRTQLVRAALAKVAVSPRAAAPISAPHVAVALVTHFLTSNAGTNLAYGRSIDPRTCRPLGDSAREPVALRRAGGGA